MTSEFQSALDVSHDGFKPGDRIGRYELLFPAARGGMATVWTARAVGSRGFCRVVALKLMADPLLVDATSRSMFLDEAQISARAVHSNLIQILDYGHVGRRPYLVMEWIDGESLWTLIKAARSLKRRL